MHFQTIYNYLSGLRIKSVIYLLDSLNGSRALFKGKEIKVVCIYTVSVDEYTQVCE